MGIQNTEINFLLILGVRAFLIPNDQFETGIFWAINSKWVKYESQDGDVGWVWKTVKDPPCRRVKRKTADSVLWLISLVE